MAHGGARAGAGRKLGGANKLDQQARQKAAEGGLMPLDYMLAVLRDDNRLDEERMDAAKAAAPYLHAKLAAIEHSGVLDVTTQTKEQRDAAVAAASRADG